ncbi:MAG: hypothetical protein PHG49_03650, partial [Candidatus Pacebacteria bacterium]|nr:hypothetical protein [Candidatus Paceibacterota bacterium]
MGKNILSALWGKARFFLAPELLEDYYDRDQRAGDLKMAQMFESRIEAEQKPSIMASYGAGKFLAEFLTGAFA